MLGFCGNYRDRSFTPYATSIQRGSFIEVRNLPVALIYDMLPDASTDIYPGNVMFALNNPLETVNEADLDEHTRLRWSQNVFPLRRVDGKPLTIHSPTYVVEPQPLDSKKTETSPLSTSRLVLSDFGAGMSKKYQLYVVRANKPSNHPRKLQRWVPRISSSFKASRSTFRITSLREI